MAQKCSKGAQKVMIAGAAPVPDPARRPKPAHPVATGDFAIFRFFFAFLGSFLKWLALANTARPAASR